MSYFAGLVTHWVHLDELGIRQGQNAQLNALTLLRSGSVAPYQNGFDRSLRFAFSSESWLRCGALPFEHDRLIQLLGIRKTQEPVAGSCAGAVSDHKISPFFRTYVEKERDAVTVHVH
jgi:hypothetical protein